jgi:hypothetical protein
VQDVAHVPHAQLGCRPNDEVAPCIGFGTASVATSGFLFAMMLLTCAAQILQLACSVHDASRQARQAARRRCVESSAGHFLWMILVDLQAVVVVLFFPDLFLLYFLILASYRLREPSPRLKALAEDPCRGPRDGANVPQDVLHKVVSVAYGAGRCERSRIAAATTARPADRRAGIHPLQRPVCTSGGTSIASDTKPAPDCRKK